MRALSHFLYYLTTKALRETRGSGRSGEIVPRPGRGGMGNMRSMPPRMGSAQRAPRLEGLRYGASTKGRRIADGLPEREGTTWLRRARTRTAPRWRRSDILNHPRPG